MDAAEETFDGSFAAFLASTKRAHAEYDEGPNSQHSPLTNRAPFLADENAFPTSTAPDTSLESAPWPAPRRLHAAGDAVPVDPAFREALLKHPHAPSHAPSHAASRPPRASQTQRTPTLSTRTRRLTSPADAAAGAAPASPPTLARTTPLSMRAAPVGLATPPRSRRRAAAMAGSDSSGNSGSIGGSGRSGRSGGSRPDHALMPAQQELAQTQTQSWPLQDFPGGDGGGGGSDGGSGGVSNVGGGGGRTSTPPPPRVPPPLPVHLRYQQFLLQQQHELTPAPVPAQAGPNAPLAAAAAAGGRGSGPGRARTSPLRALVWPLPETPLQGPPLEQVYGRAASAVGTRQPMSDGDATATAGHRVAVSPGPAASTPAHAVAGGDAGATLALATQRLSELEQATQARRRELARVLRGTAAAEAALRERVEAAAVRTRTLAALEREVAALLAAEAASAAQEGPARLRKEEATALRETLRTLRSELSGVRRAAEAVRVYAQTLTEQDHVHKESLRSILSQKRGAQQATEIQAHADALRKQLETDSAAAAATAPTAAQIDAAQTELAEASAACERASGECAGTRLKVLHAQSLRARAEQAVNEARAATAHKLEATRALVARFSEQNDRWSQRLAKIDERLQRLRR